MVVTTAVHQRYQSPAAARQAVTDKLRLAAGGTAWQLADLQRQYAYDEFIERLYRLDDAWVITGEIALLARRLPVRQPKGIDLYHPGAVPEIERVLRDAADLDIGDWMSFEIGPAATSTADETRAARHKVRAFIGAKLWSTFRITVVADGMVMSGATEPVRPLTNVHATDRHHTTWNAYPLVGGSRSSEKADPVAAADREGALDVGGQGGS